ncbi:hypothetical protein EJ02DRAFT_511150 [Clathrospora elynae]|uniref:Uncharacterized protein n=1 Tax=Clathrospora elynae TaxID=706981 RepID=A0A6A5SR13_9PLEO|nr:hypothetical protein EJ02DRAFT_511150 [Clathrospora elynae]
MISKLASKWPPNPLRSNRSPPPRIHIGDESAPTLHHQHYIRNAVRHVDVSPPTNGLPNETCVNIEGHVVQCSSPSSKQMKDNEFATTVLPENAWASVTTEDPLTAIISATTQAQNQSPTASDGTATPSLVSAENVASTSNISGSGLSSGAVAGIAIGTLIMGATIAFLAAFFVFKRRNKRYVNVGARGHTSYADSIPELAMVRQKSVGLGGRNSSYVQVSKTPIPAPVATPIPAPVPVQQSNISSAVPGFLPPASHESTICGRVSALFGQIHRHVETYYRDVHTSITPSMAPELAQFGAKDMDMAELLQDCSSQITVLKHALVAYVLDITGPNKAEYGETIFPEELYGMKTQDSHGAGSDPSLRAATALHRRLSVYLYTARSSNSNSHRSWTFQSDVREAAEHFALTFFPWANPTASDQEKDEDLAQIISEALEMRIWLYGQPCEYEFEWEGAGRRGVLVSPGLVRWTNERGEGEERRVVEGVAVGV